MEDWLIYAALAWVGFQAVLGWRRGLWNALLGLVALGLAYLASILWGASFAKWLQSLPLFSAELAAYTSFIAYPLIFIVITSVFPMLARALLPFLKSKSHLLRAAGAVVGAGIGSVMVLIFIWFIDFAAEALNKDASVAVAGENSALNQVAKQFVGELTEAGLKLAGNDPAQAEAIAAVMSEPGTVISSVKALGQSDNMRKVVHSQRLQRMMASNDVSSLSSSREFQMLVADPAAEPLLKQLERGGRTQAQAEDFLAEQMTFVWRRMLAVKHDARVAPLLEDQAWRRSLADKNPAQLMADQNFQKLVSVIMESRPELDTADLSALLDKESRGRHSDSLPSSEAKPYMRSTVYKWVDDGGQVQYSDWQDIPEHKRASAERFLN
ncbi:CvpA family protein [Agaribacterium haliotis]|uniref:CvpA family protein n=1 Tax=Agaribacterium haliotis TaxID=2013869 RepID=UPI000BB584E8|nr:CvpA family protein [Agaribacterium haliotis]